MKSFIIGITSALLFAAPTLHAEEFSTEIVPILYFNAPFGSTQKSTEPFYGLQLKHTGGNARDGFNLFENERPAMLDIRMKEGEHYFYPIFLVTHWCKDGPVSTTPK